MDKMMSINDIENYECDQCMVVTRRVTKEAKVAMSSVYSLKGDYKGLNKMQRINWDK